MNRQAAEWIGTVFYIGKLPLAPGTWASLIATISWYFLFQNQDPILLPTVTAFLFLLGSLAADTVIRNSKDHDPSRIVIDEWVGPVSYTHLTLPTTPYV